jgi:ABC-2 type transport system ATP-binding protein
MEENSYYSSLHKYIDQGDNELAIRRIMDLAFDSEDELLIQKSIELHKNFKNDSNSWKTSFDNIFKDLNKINFKEPPQENLLIANGISKTYKKGNFNLANIDISLKVGEITGLVGENGNGKTTLLRLLANQLKETSGTYDYKDIDSNDNYLIKDKVAYIPQRIPRWYGFLKDNLHYSASIKGIKGSKNDLYVNFILERFNLSNYAHLNWNQISSGYRTRFQIAKIVLQRPKLLILDEPLANLDVVAQQTLLVDLKMLAKSSINGMSIILSSQQLHEVEKIADQIIMLKNGATINQDAGEYQYVVEIETEAQKSDITNAIGNDIKVMFNGGYYTLFSNTLSNHSILEILIKNNIQIDYYRNISGSAKKFFL